MESNLVFPYAVSAVIGIAAWVCINWLWNPWQEFRVLRANIQQKIIYYGNLDYMDLIFDGKTIQEGQNEIRSLASQLIAVTEGFFPWHKMLVRILNYKIEAAASALMGLSNTRKDDLSSIFAYEARHYLKLRQTIQAETYQKLCALAGYGSPLLDKLPLTSNSPRAVES